MVITSLFLPYYSHGNLQDLVTSHSNSGSTIPEREILTYFLGTAKAVRAMHRHTPKKTSTNGTHASSTSYPPSGSTKSLETVVFSPSMGISPANSQSPTQAEIEDEDEDEDALAKTEEERQEAPLMGNLSSHATVQEDTDGPVLNSPLVSDEPSNSAGKKAMEPWAHRDLKPANVMLSDTGEPILMDFGSALRARVEIPKRSVALQQQDLAAELSHLGFVE